MSHVAASSGRKLFVGSLPQNVADQVLRGEFSKFGDVEDVFVKPGCEMGRQWGFVTMSTPEAALLAKDACDRILHFPGSERPCDVMIAKGGPGGPMATSSSSATIAYSTPVQTMQAGTAPRKVFIGSLPNTISDMELRAEFSKYGQILDVHINNKPCEVGRQWAFVCFASSDQAQFAKDSTDRLIAFPGSDKACEVTLARHQGMFGQDSLTTDSGGRTVVAAPVYAQVPGAVGGPRKIFVGSLPQNITSELLQAEFSKYGQVVDVHINYKAAEPGRNWAFVTFATHEQATYAKDATDRVLVVPGADRPCEVMLAKNQGAKGQDPAPQPAGGAVVVSGYAPPPAPVYAVQQPMPYGVQPPPPSVPPPPSLTPWRMYKTAAGLPYYHNHSTGQTQWECPPDLQVPGQGAYGAAASMVQTVQYAPY